MARVPSGANATSCGGPIVGLRAAPQRTPVLDRPRLYCAFRVDGVPGAPRPGSARGPVVHIRLYRAPRCPRRVPRRRCPRPRPPFRSVPSYASSLPRSPGARPSALNASVREQTRRVSATTWSRVAGREIPELELDSILRPRVLRHGVHDQPPPVGAHRRIEDDVVLVGQYIDLCRWSRASQTIAPCRPRSGVQELIPSGLNTAASRPDSFAVEQARRAAGGSRARSRSVLRVSASSWRGKPRPRGADRGRPGARSATATPPRSARPRRDRARVGPPALDERHATGDQRDARASTASRRAGAAAGGSYAPGAAVPALPRRRWLSSTNLARASTSPRRWRAIRRRREALAPVELARILSRLPPGRRRHGEVPVQPQAVAVLVEPRAQGGPLADEGLVGDLDAGRPPS